MSQDALVIDGRPISIAQVEQVARQYRAVRLGDAARDAMTQSAEHIRQIAGGHEPVYGVNTGFGSLSLKRIAADDVRAVQRNLIRSHSAGVGEPLPDDTVRAMMLCLAGSLARGKSGARVEVAETLIDMLNAGITPVVPSRGSVGASGDLAPLSHVVLAMMGEGQVRDAPSHSQSTGSPRSHNADFKPITLEAKEGLALINGTHFMTGSAALSLAEVSRLFDAALAAAALAIDANRATDAFLDPRLHDARQHPGQQHVAAVLREMLAGSQILLDHRDDDPRVQDPYSLRAIPPVLGAVYEMIEHVRRVFERELGAVTDNPLVFIEQPKGEPRSVNAAVISGANFHGMPLAIALDALKIALCHLAGIAERRVYWLLAASDSENTVNTYLSPQPGLHSGMMIVQYTAAACCNELQSLAGPASVFNIPTSAGMEDYNSMGATAAHQVRQAVELATNVIAIELLVMTEAMEYQRPLRSGDGVERTYSTVRSVVPRLTKDRPPAPDIKAIADLIRADRFTA